MNAPSQRYALVDTFATCSILFYIYLFILRTKAAISRLLVAFRADFKRILERSISRVGLVFQQLTLARSLKPGFVQDAKEVYADAQARKQSANQDPK